MGHTVCDHNPVFRSIDPQYPTLVVPGAPRRRMHYGTARPAGNSRAVASADSVFSVNRGGLM